MRIVDAQVHIWSKTVVPTFGLHRKVTAFTADQLRQGAGSGTLIFHGLVVEGLVEELFHSRRPRPLGHFL